MAVAMHNTVNHCVYLHQDSVTIWCSQELKYFLHNKISQIDNQINEKGN